MNPKRSTLKLVLGGALALALIALVPSFLVAIGPDKELQFTRDVPSKASIEKLGAQVSDLSKWPEWFFSLKEVQTVSATGDVLPKEQQKLFEGARLKLSIEPKKKQWKRFQITALVEAYRPNDYLRLRILGDSKGKLSELFENLVWQINLLPSPALTDVPARAKDGTPNLTLIRGQVAARGISWRSKIFGTVTPRILMAQVFYPDLIRLAETGTEKTEAPMSSFDGS